MAINLVTEYLFDKYVVYRNAMDTNERARRQDIKGLKRTVSDYYVALATLNTRFQQQQYILSATSVIGKSNT